MSILKPISSRLLSVTSASTTRSTRRRIRSFTTRRLWACPDELRTARRSRTGHSTSIASSWLCCQGFARNRIYAGPFRSNSRMSNPWSEEVRALVSILAFQAYSTQRLPAAALQRGHTFKVLNRLRLAGVDMLQGEDGPLVMEVNSSPGLQGIETATKLDVAGAIIDCIAGQVAFTEIDVRQRLTVSTGYGVAELMVHGAADLLEEVGLWERDITILTLHRGMSVIPNPSKNATLEADDRLF